MTTVLPRSLALLLLLFVGLAMLYNAAVPLGEGPDESGHMNYVLFLAREARLPVQRSEGQASDVPGEGHQPPLAYLLALPAVLWLPPEARQFEQSANPQFLWNDGSESAAFIRASQEYWPWQGVVLAWHLARTVSTLLGAITIVGIWAAAQPLCARWQRPHLALFAAALAALNPQFLFSAALVSNDMLLAALSAGLFWLCVAAPAASAPRFYWQAAAGGVLLGLALLTKQNALLLLPLLLWWSWRSAAGWRQRAAHSAAWLGTALLLAGWWYLRNWQLYSDPLGLSAFRATYATQDFVWHSLPAWGSALLQLHASFWARFGWLSLHPPAWILWLYALLGLAALVGLLRHVVRAGLLPPGGWRAALRNPWAGVLLLPLLALAWVVSFALTAGLVAWQGRMLFPALPALALLLALGLDSLPRSPQAWRVLWGLLLPVLLLLAWTLPLLVIAPAYPWHTLPPAAALERIERPVYARYAQEWERGIELRGWYISSPGAAGKADSQAVRAGQAISVTLIWHALERVPEDWTVFLHLVDDAGGIVAESNSKPQNGQMPLPLWTPGDWLRDTHTLALPADLPPGSYRLRVGLYLPWQRDPRQGRRQPVWAADGSPMGDMAEIGAIQVRQP